MSVHVYEYIIYLDVAINYISLYHYTAPSLLRTPTVADIYDVQGGPRALLCFPE